MLQIRLNAFDMATPGHIQQGLWTHPRDNSHAYNTITHWTDLSRTLERGLFDGLFLAAHGQVADTLETWMGEADLDGFNLSRTVMAEGLNAFIDLVIPVLQGRGLDKTEFAPGTLREKLLGHNPRLPPTHPAAAHRT